MNRSMQRTSISNIALMRPVRDLLYCSGIHGKSPCLENTSVTSSKMKDSEDSQYPALELCECLSQVKGCLEGTQLVSKASKRPYIRFGVVQLLLHKFW